MSTPSLVSKIIRPVSVAAEDDQRDQEDQQEPAPVRRGPPPGARAGLGLRRLRPRHPAVAGGLGGMREIPCRNTRLGGTAGGPGMAGAVTSSAAGSAAGSRWRSRGATGIRTIALHQRG